jgi:hypothetical protein
MHVFLSLFLVPAEPNAVTIIISIFSFALAAVGNNVVVPLCAPTQLLFDAVNNLSKLYLSKHGLPLQSNFAAYCYTE